MKVRFKKNAELLGMSYNNDVQMDKINSLEYIGLENCAFNIKISMNKYWLIPTLQSKEENH